MKYAARLIDLTKNYYLGENVVRALRSVSLDIPEGDFLAIMGSSGSGKSTMLNLMGALDRPTSGQYLLAGRDVSVLDDDDLSLIRNELIGFIFQSFHLIPQYSVLDNIMLTFQYRRGSSGITSKDENRAIDIAGRVGLDDRLDHKPFQLSGGQQQRVAIARSLINDPQIIMADEPTGNLDSSTSEEIMNLLTELNEEGRTIIMVTHEPEIAARSKNQIYMRDGEIAGKGIFPGNLKSV